MPHRSPSKAVLVASRDPHLADVRRRVLENAGFRVFSATNVDEVQKACKEKPIALVLVGYSLFHPAISGGSLLRLASTAKRQCLSFLRRESQNSSRKFGRSVTSHTHPRIFCKKVSPSCRKTRTSRLSCGSSIRNPPASKTDFNN